MFDSTLRNSFRGTCRRRLAALSTSAAAITLLCLPVAHAAIYAYDNNTITPNTSIPETIAANCVSSGRAVTFTVPDIFNVSVGTGTLAVGLTATHTDRDQIHAVLRGPNLDTATVLTGVTSGGDGPNNYDILLSTYNLGSLNDTDDDPTAIPNYNRLVYSGAATTFNAFSGDAANGTWTLFLCDTQAGSGTGNVVSARLILSDALVLGEVCSAKATYEWCGAAACNGTAFPLAGDTVANTGGVMLNLASFQDVGNDDNGGWDTYVPSFARQNETLGAHTGFYSSGMNITGGAAPAGAEAAAMATTWTFTLSGSPVQVSGLEWTALDVDFSNGGNSFRDLLRATGYTGTALASASVPFVQTLEGCNAAAGDLALGTCEIVHGSPGSAGANPTRRYLRGVASLLFGYNSSEDVTPEIQYVGIADPRFCVYDFGDAPDTGVFGANYGTVSNTTAARHVMGQRNLYLGVLPPDGELVGNASATANGDHTQAGNILNDEDGVASFPNYTPPSTTYSVTVNATNTSGSAAFLYGYIDWNRDGDFADANERSQVVNVANNTLADGFAPEATNHSVTWTSVPANAGGTAATFARFRISTSDAAAQVPTGFAPDGEVEDYQIVADTLPVTLAWVDSSIGRRGLEVRWATSMEDRNGGFRIWGQDARGERRLLGVVPSEVVDSFAPQSYAATFDAPGVVAVEIEDLALDGKNRLHGPFAVGKSSGERPSSARIEWAAIRSELEPAAESVALDRMVAASAQLARPVAERPLSMAILKIREEGIQRVTYEDLFARGIDLSGVPANRIGVFNNGTLVPRFTNQAGSFGPGSFIEFVARPQTTLASPFDAFELRINRTPLQNPAALAAGSGRSVIVQAEARHHADIRYSASSPNGDPWYDALLLGRPGNPAQATRGFDLPDLDTGAVDLTVDLWGYSYFGDAAPDHHVVLRLNGEEIADERFDGLTAWTRTIDVTSVVQESGNELRVEIPGDVPYVFDVVNLEGFSLKYPRRSVALDGRFHFRGSAPTTSRSGYAVDGFTGASVVAWSKAGGAYSRGELAPIGGRVSVASSQAAAYFADPTAIWRPEVEAGAPEPAHASSAEYVILTDPAFVAELGPLVGLQESRGFTTEVVTVDRIFAAYSDHVASAEALRQFLASSSTNLRYVLIVGAASSDPWDHLGIGSVSFVPTTYLPVVSDVSFSPTDEAIADLNGDGFPEVPIGRLPVRTPAEAANAIDKLLAWESNVVGSSQALLVAGASDAERVISEINETYRDAIPSWQTTLMQVDDLGLAAVRQATIDGMNAGIPLVSFVGHSSQSVWDFDPILRWQDVDAFTNFDRPNLVTQWGCWNSYYVEPNYESMSGRMMNAMGGAAATIGASTLTTEPSHRRLGQLFFQQMEAGASRIGDAFLAAKRILRQEGSPSDAILGMMLLGDPAMPLPSVHSAP